jgi:phosphatidylethanolamine/phosphatidyl-N-methylethanolamine N-methyltransferase
MTTDARTVGWPAIERLGTKAWAHALSRECARRDSTNVHEEHSMREASGQEAVMQQDAATGAKWLYFRRWLAHPLQMASVLPASEDLCRQVAAAAMAEGNGRIVELGAGTGSVTQALLEAGVAPQRLIAVELDPHLARHLRATVPDVEVIEGDAFSIDRLLPREWLGTSTIVCGLPITFLPFARQRAIVDAMTKVLAPGKPFIQYTYRWVSPIPLDRLGLVGRRVGLSLANLPPATVWAFRPAVAA